MRNIFFSFLILMGVYAISSLFINVIGKYVSKEQADSPDIVTKVESGVTTVSSTINSSADAVVTIQPSSASIQKVMVIANRDSKRFHLPGMRYYHRVEAHHRIEFSSEDEAMKAGYHKAPR